MPANTVKHIGSKSLPLNLRTGSAVEPRVTMHQVLVFSNLQTHKSVAIPANVRKAPERFILFRG